MLTIHVAGLLICVLLIEDANCCVAEYNGDGLDSSVSSF